VAFSACYDMSSDCDVIEASKTATNFMSFDSTNGLVVSQDATANAGNVQIKSDGFRIRNGTTVNASFLGNTITLGQNSTSSYINLCGDRGQIKLGTSISGNTSLVIKSVDVELLSDVSTSLLCKPTYPYGLQSGAYSAVHANAPVTTTVNGVQYRELQSFNICQGTTNAGKTITCMAGSQINENGGGSGASIRATDGTNTSFVQATTTSAYVKSAGIVQLEGSDVQIAASNAKSAVYRPYYRKGDSLSINLSGAGFITSSSSKVYFTIPLARPAIGSPTVTVSSVSGLQIRQGAAYLYGSSASAYASVSSYSAVLEGANHIRIIATMPNTTNVVTNNDTCGIYASIKITFS
jgi:hypothetical protein